MLSSPSTSLPASETCRTKHNRSNLPSPSLCGPHVVEEACSVASGYMQSILATPYEGNQTENSPVVKHWAGGCAGEGVLFKVRGHEI